VSPGAGPARCKPGRAGLSSRASKGASGGSRERAVQARVFLAAASHLIWVSGSEGGSEVRAPRQKAPTRGSGVVDSTLNVPNAPPWAWIRAVPGAATSCIHFDCFQLVVAARCARALAPSASARLPWARRGGGETRAHRAPAPGMVGKRRFSVSPIPSGNLASQVLLHLSGPRGDCTLTALIQLVILDLGFSELSPHPKLGVSFQNDPEGEVSLIVYPLKLE
jgi:hypothetical protein